MEGGYPLLLLFGLARHTKCILSVARASLLVCEQLPAKGDPLTASRIRITGRMEKNSFTISRSHSLAESYRTIRFMVCSSRNIEQPDG